MVVDQRRPRERTWRTAEADFDQADEDLRRDRWSYGKDHLGYLHAFDPKAREDLIWNGLEWEEFYGHPHIKEDLRTFLTLVQDASPTLTVLV